jgi:Nif-specific regulatory protein
MRARLTVESGECTPNAAELIPGSTVTIGRSRDNVLVIKDDLTSRLHAKIYFEDGKWMVRDFGLNGTKVAGHRINGVAELKEGAEVQIGHVRFRYHLAVAGAPLTVPASKLAAAVAGKTPQPPTTPGSGSSAAPRTRSDKETRTQKFQPRETLVSIPANGSTVPPGPNEDDTSLRADELSALCKYMTAAAAITEPYELIALSLRTALNQTSAALVGYLSLDPAEPIVKMVLPEKAAVDVPLSLRLTEKVRATKKPFWLFGEEDTTLNAASLSSFSDAICLPVQGTEGEPLAALHAYRTGRGFNERDLKFLEAVAAFLSPSIDSLRNRRSLEADNLRLRGSASAAEELIGDSSAMMNLRQQIGRSAPMPFTVLIQGESGSGKELVALALHRHSQRASGPFVVVNCAGIAPALVEGELFGYRKGAFAGADHDHPGLFEQADDGTIFLDEVADLSPECQAKLLRIIEGKTFRPVGGMRDVTLDVRVIAATSRDLEAEVKAGRFRQDLLFRLKVIPIRVPPLREHPEDIVELSRFFLERLSVQCRRQFRMTPAGEQKLYGYRWPGNVRQLRAVLESAAVMSDQDAIDAEMIPLGGTAEMAALQTASPADAPASLDIDDLETWAIVKALRQTAGNVSQAARVLGISRDTLHTKLKIKNIDRKAVGASAEN